jgi:hypothetical protein
MAMGTRTQREKQDDLWIAHTELAVAPGHPFYQRLNELLEAKGFDEYGEGRCACRYHTARSWLFSRFLASFPLRAARKTMVAT